MSSIYGNIKSRSNSGLAGRSLGEDCIGFNIFMNAVFALLVNDTDIHFSGVQVDTAIILVLLVVKSHSLASFHQIDYGLGVNRFYTDDVSEATSRGVFRARIGP